MLMSNCAVAVLDLGAAFFFFFSRETGLLSRTGLSPNAMFSIDPCKTAIEQCLLEEICRHVDKSECCRQFVL